MMTAFRIGKVVCTQTIDKMMQENLSFASWVTVCLERHCSGDWGDISEEDKEMNDESVRQEREGGFPDSLMSSYEFGTMEIWIITESDRSVTTVLLPEEY